MDPQGHTISTPNPQLTLGFTLVLQVPPVLEISKGFSGPSFGWRANWASVCGVGGRLGPHGGTGTGWGGTPGHILEVTLFRTGIGE